MLRRDFIVAGVKVSLSLLLCDALAVPAWGQRNGGIRRGRRLTNPANLTVPPAGLDDSLNVVAAYLAEYAPPEGGFPAGGAWTAQYDLLEWKGSPSMDGAKFSRGNRVVGQLAVTRRPGPGRVAYDVDQAITLNGFKSTLRSSSRCTADPLPALVDWTTDYEMSPSSRSGSTMKLAERGRHQGGLLEITTATGLRRFQTDRPVAPQWAVLDALAGAKGTRPAAAPAVEFDLFHDLTSYRPQQRLQACGVLEIRLDGRVSTLHGFVQMGRGAQPTHYWIDDAGRPLLVTGGLGASALTSLREA
jgi:hypothetical protein